MEKRKAVSPTAQTLACFGSPCRCVRPRGTRGALPAVPVRSATERPVPGAGRPFALELGGEDSSAWGALRPGGYGGTSCLRSKQVVGEGHLLPQPQLREPSACTCHHVGGAPAIPAEVRGTVRRVPVTQNALRRGQSPRLVTGLQWSVSAEAPPVSGGEGPALQGSSHSHWLPTTPATPSPWADEGRAGGLGVGRGVVGGRGFQLSHVDNTREAEVGGVVV